MHARSPGGLDDRLGIRAGLEARDVFSHRAVKQFDILGEIADMVAELLGRPLVDRCSIAGGSTLVRQAKPRSRPAQALISRTRSDR